MPKVVDLFCGIGGLTHGFSGFGSLEVVAGIDADERCRYSYEENNRPARFVHRDINGFSADDLGNLFGDAETRILVGCAPCQPFSRYTQNKTEDDKWRLLYKFGELVEETLPEIVSMENVPTVVSHRVFRDFVALLRRLNYHVSYRSINCLDYGVPQTRRRLVLFASLLGEIEMVPPTHTPDQYRTVRQVIGHLESIVAGASSTTDEVHFASALNETNLRRIAASTPGGTWRDWPEDLVLECHKRATGRSFDDVYGRMAWDAPAPTMTTHCIGIGKGRFGHPDQDRGVSVRETSLFQTFPPTYRFVDPTVGFLPTVVSRQIGNAVPVHLGVAIAQTIWNHLDDLNLV